MLTIHEARDAILRVQAALTLEPSDEGNIRYVIQDGLSVEVVELDDGTIDLVTLLSGVPVNEATLEKLLEANHLGDGTGAGRLCLDERGRVALVTRLTLKALSRETLGARLGAHVEYAGYCSSGAFSNATVEDLAFSSDTIAIRI